jgi:hypothetical protein
VYGDTKLPSVTTILSKTKDDAKLKEWVYKLIRNAPQSGKQVDFVPSAKISRNMV